MFGIPLPRPRFLSVVILTVCTADAQPWEFKSLTPRTDSAVNPNRSYDYPGYNKVSGKTTGFFHVERIGGTVRIESHRFGPGVYIMKLNNAEWNEKYHVMMHETGKNS